MLVTGGAVGVAGLAAACGVSSGGSAVSASGQPTQSPDATSATPEASGTVLGPVAQIPVGGGQVNDTAQVVVTQPQEGTYNGFTAVCPHQGCLVSTVQDNEILCPCHGSLFSAEDGSVIQGPATMGLAPVPVKVEGDMVVLA